MRKRDPHDGESVTVTYVEMKRETEKAAFFVFNTPEGKRGEWFPKSQIRSHDETSKAFECDHWIARDKGLI